MLQSAAMLPSLSLGSATSSRDREWEERECSYHYTAVAELNSLVRKYNALVPCSVRCPYYSQESELAEAYEDCGDVVLHGISERSRGRCVAGWVHLHYLKSSLPRKSMLPCPTFEVLRYHPSVVYEAVRQIHRRILNSMTCSHICPSLGLLLRFLFATVCAVT
ncbi:hypothetical protein EDB19DRAFT_1842732 [Suillus lakei]|nr:hypothetical protein EDB19DRAFT_1842732 [Suillus lakei]